MTETFTPPVVYGAWDLGMAFLLGVAVGALLVVSVFIAADDQ